MSRSGQLYHMFSANANGVLRHVLFPVDTCNPMTSPTSISGSADVTKVMVKTTRRSPSQVGTRVVILPATSRTRQRSMICEPIRDFPSSPAKSASDRSATWATMAFNWTPPCYVTSGRSVTVLASSRSLPPSCRSTAVIQRSNPATVAAVKARRKSSLRPQPKYAKGKVKATAKPVIEVKREPPLKSCSLVVPRCPPHERRSLFTKQTLYGPKVPIVVNGSDISPLGARRLYDRGDILRGDDMQVRIARRVAMEMRLGLPSGGALWNTRKLHCGGDDDDCVVTRHVPPTNRGDARAVSRPTQVVRESKPPRTSTTVASSVGRGAFHKTPEVSAEVRELWSRRMQKLPIRGAGSVSSVITRLVEQRKMRLSEAVLADSRRPGGYRVPTEPNKRTRSFVNVPAGSVTRTETRPVRGDDGL
ncbi:hypothetical protein NP493_419g04048 [Ridgeia piscesae]|uniref:Uncharacterized protein n=1 Tax=Ridgeia piscesae TaxID=27915 RepID=A0AAD9L089_RIDPI|nr:hypothetical protein NP493_419g04048 [Ridgeia piscesae]